MASRCSFPALIVRHIEHKPWIAFDHRQKHARRPSWLAPSLFPVTKGFNGHADEIGEHLLRGTHAAARSEPDCPDLKRATFWRLYYRETWSSTLHVCAPLNPVRNYASGAISLSAFSFELFYALLELGVLLRGVQPVYETRIVCTRRCCPYCAIATEPRWRGRAVAKSQSRRPGRGSVGYATIVVPSPRLTFDPPALLVPRNRNLW